MNIALLLKSELRRSAGILAGMALIIALALSIAVAAGICERMVKASAAQSADDFDLLTAARAANPLPDDFSQSRLKPLRAPPQAMSSETNFPLCTAEFMALATHMRALLTK